MVIFPVLPLNLVGVGKQRQRPFSRTRQHKHSFYIPSNSPLSPQNVYLGKEEVSLMFFSQISFLYWTRTSETQQPNTESFFLFCHSFQGRVISKQAGETHISKLTKMLHHCHRMNRVLQNSYVEVVTPLISKWDLGFGDGFFKKVIDLK